MDGWMDGWIYPLCTSTAAKAVTLAMVQRGQGAWILQIVSRERMLVPLFLLTAAWHIYNLKHVFFSECAVCFFPPVSSMFFFSLRISPWDHDHMVHKPSNFYNGFLAENMVQTLKPWVSPGRGQTTLWLFHIPSGKPTSMENHNSSWENSL